MRMRVVVADDVQPKVVQLVVDAQLVAGIHVVVHRTTSGGRDTRRAIAKHARVSVHLGRGIAHWKYALDFAATAAEDATLLVRITCPRVFHELTLHLIWK